MTGLALFIATVGKAGYSRFAPGTVGSAVGLAIYLAMYYVGLDAVMQVALTVLVTAGGVWAASEAARQFQQEDPSQVVVDEVAGQMVTLVLTGVSLKGALIGFLLFRVLDILKPWPAGRIERLHGGIGIVGDDVVVALFGNAILQVVRLTYPDLL